MMAGDDEKNKVELASVCGHEGVPKQAFDEAARTRGRNLKSSR